LFRWMYTSVPYPSSEMSWRSPPKYLAYCMHLSGSGGEGDSSASTHQPTQRQPIPKPGHRRPKVALPKVLTQRLALHRCVHIRPNERHRAPRDPAALVGDLDGDVFLALDGDDLDGRVGVGGAVVFYGCSERVFEELETDVVSGDNRISERSALWKPE
jgi:hypothetical protein